MFISFLLRIFPAVAIICIAICVIMFFVFRARGEKKPFIRYAALWGFMCYCMALIYFTLLWYWPDITFTPEWYFLNLEPFIWVKETYIMGEAKMLGQLALNIGMFVPMGALLPIIFKRLRHFYSTSLVSLGATVCIETLQYFMGRSADIDDVITNFAGAAIGYLIYWLLNRWLGTVRFWKNALNLT